MIQKVHDYWCEAAPNSNYQNRSVLIGWLDEDIFQMIDQTKLNTIIAIQTDMF